MLASSGLTDSCRTLPRVRELKQHLGVFAVGIGVSRTLPRVRELKLELKALWNALEKSHPSQGA